MVGQKMSTDVQAASIMQVVQDLGQYIHPKRVYMDGWSYCYNTCYTPSGFSLAYVAMLRSTDPLLSFHCEGAGIQADPSGKTSTQFYVNLSEWTRDYKRDLDQGWDVEYIDTVSEALAAYFALEMEPRSKDDLAYHVPKLKLVGGPKSEILEMQDAVREAMKYKKVSSTGKFKSKPCVHGTYNKVLRGESEILSLEFVN